MLDLNLISLGDKVMAPDGHIFTVLGITVDKVVLMGRKNTITIDKVRMWNWKLLEVENGNDI